MLFANPCKTEVYIPGNFPATSLGFNRNEGNIVDKWKLIKTWESSGLL